MVMVVMVVEALVVMVMVVMVVEALVVVVMVVMVVVALVVVVVVMVVVMVVVTYSGGIRIPVHRQQHPSVVPVHPADLIHIDTYTHIYIYLCFRHMF
jgi:hypothetical protein